mgnify:CR=1 FL=1
MSRALFYVDAVPDVGGLAVVDGDEGFHAATVRRIRPGEELDLSDGAGTLAHCVIEDAVKGRLTARVLSVTDVPAAVPTVTVVQALPKSERSELAIELAADVPEVALPRLAVGQPVAAEADVEGHRVAGRVEGPLLGKDRVMGFEVPLVLGEPVRHGG